MKTSPLALACTALCVLTPFAAAQEGTAAPKPAEQLKRLEPLVGRWSGTGTIQRPQRDKTPWRAEGSFRWSHGGFWLQEDMVVHFEGIPGPVAARVYFGWDAENRRYVACGVHNDGEVRLDEVEFLPDGAMMTMTTRRQPMTLAERMVVKVEGDTMTHTIGLLLPDMMLDYATGEFRRADAEPVDALAVAAYGEPAGDEMTQLNRAAGAYDIEGSLVMMPGAPPAKVTGTDTWISQFGGNVLWGRTEGAAEGMPGRYVGDVFWSWNEKRSCFVSVFVTNMGEVGAMDMWATTDGTGYISTVAATAMGQPMVQRHLLTVDEAGAFKGGVSHTIMGAAPPFQSFTVTYRKQQ